MNEITINKDGKYRSLWDDIEEIKKRGIEGLYATYWEVGKRIRKELPLNGSFNEQAELKPLLDVLAKDTKINKQTLYQSVQFFDKFPNGIKIKDLPDNASWTKIRTELLPEKKKKSIRELTPVKEIIEDSKPTAKVLTDKCDDCPIVRKLADKISELETIIKALRNPKQQPIMGFNHARIQKRYLELYEKKKGYKSGFIKWPAFNKALGAVANSIPEQVIYDGWENFFSDKWTNENGIFDPLIYLNHIDKYIGKKNVEELRKEDPKLLKKIMDER